MFVYQPQRNVGAGTTGATPGRKASTTGKKRPVRMTSTIPSATTATAAVVAAKKAKAAKAVKARARSKDQGETTKTATATTTMPGVSPPKQRNKSRTTTAVGPNLRQNNGKINTVIGTQANFYASKIVLRPDRAGGATALVYTAAVPASSVNAPNVPASAAATSAAPATALAPTSATSVSASKKNAAAAPHASRRSDSNQASGKESQKKQKAKKERKKDGRASSVPRENRAAEGPRKGAAAPPQPRASSHERKDERPCGRKLQDVIGDKLDTLMAAMDRAESNVDEKDLVMPETLEDILPPKPKKSAMPSAEHSTATGVRGGGTFGSSWPFSTSRPTIFASGAATSQQQTQQQQQQPRTFNPFAKAQMYANSRLPADLPTLKLYIPAYPLICVAAGYSQRAYEAPAAEQLRRGERRTQVAADWRQGTKAMVVKSVPLDDRRLVVFAVRGTHRWIDWADNIRTKPASAEGFLDDAGNLCHTGFLSVAKRTVPVVVERLRALLRDDPARTECSLLFTGHSAGGAVAALLFAHMLAENVKSDLADLAGCFKRIHCVTFGAPPVTLLPLRKPDSPRHRRSLFLSFINEGDLVTRMEIPYCKSLLDLWASPAPGPSSISAQDTAPPAPAPALPPPPPPPLKTFKFPFGLCKNKHTSESAPASATPPPLPPPRRYVWPVPESTLSNAGRLVLLRPGDDDDDDMVEGEQREGRGSARSGGISAKALVIDDQQLRGVVFGNPMMHRMELYARRVDYLATRAVTARELLSSP